MGNNKGFKENDCDKSFDSFVKDSEPEPAIRVYAPVAEANRVFAPAVADAQLAQDLGRI